MTKQVEQWICIRLCVKLEHSSMETIWMIQKAMAQMLQRWSIICKSNPRCVRHGTRRTPENVEYVWTAINKDWWLTVREPEADLVIPKNTVFEIWHRFLAWNVSRQNSLHGFCYQSRGNIVLQMVMTLGELCEVPRCLLWRGLRWHYPMYNVSCILYLLQ